MTNCLSDNSFGDLLAGTDWQLDQEFRLRQHPADPVGSKSKCRKD